MEKHRSKNQLHFALYGKKDLDRMESGIIFIYVKFGVIINEQWVSNKTMTLHQFNLQ